jgi:16S rRNA (adenine1518-N6/adenine1519-N6)-dimethyltransferase
MFQVRFLLLLLLTMYVSNLIGFIQPMKVAYFRSQRLPGFFNFKPLVSAFSTTKSFGSRKSAPTFASNHKSKKVNIESPNNDEVLKKKKLNPRAISGHPSPAKRRHTVFADNDDKNYLKSVLPKGDYERMVRDEKLEIVQENYFNRGIKNYQDDYKLVKRQRLAQRGLNNKERKEGEKRTLIDEIKEDVDDENRKQQQQQQPLQQREPLSSSIMTSSSLKTSRLTHSRDINLDQSKLYTIMKNPSSSSSSSSSSSVSSSFSSSQSSQEESEEKVPNRPFTLPPGEFRPKQSLGQNYLSDQNYVSKIISAFNVERLRLPSQKSDKKGKQVIEIGPGLGAITRTLFPIYPEMLAIEVDQRAIEILKNKLSSSLKVIHKDILDFNFEEYYHQNFKENEKLAIIANLPYHIVSQVLFSLADAHKVIDLAVVTCQLEVGERITAKPREKDYGIPSVVFQLYGKTNLLFKIPPTVFYPVPKVDSALISIDFTKPHPELERVDKLLLRK